MPSGEASASCAKRWVLIFVAFVRIADSRWVLPVLYSMTVPGSAMIGLASANCTQLRLRTHDP